MITVEEETYILSQAYVPEHIVSLMVLLSKGEPFLIEDYLCYVKDNWLIFIGYPLAQNTSLEKIENILKGTIARFQPEYVWYIGQSVPPSLSRSCTERESDQYYKLDLQSLVIKKDLMRMVQKVKKELTLERSRTMNKEHEGLIKECVKREKPNPWIKAHFLSMPDYIKGSQSAVVLNARNRNGQLLGFYVVELGAKTFATYVVGSHSKKYYVPHASDLLFFEMINLTAEHGKKMIHLGLGVNEGIRRFKEKWGGMPYLNYEFCERFYGYTRTVSLIKSLEGKL